MTNDSYILSVTSVKPLEMVCEAIQTATTEHKFGVVGMHDLQATMKKKGVAFERECRIFEICNPHQAQKVLSANMEISTALPCRVSIYEEEGKTVLSTIRPTAMLGLFGEEELSIVAQEVEATITAIMEKAAAE